MKKQLYKLLILVVSFAFVSCNMDMIDKDSSVFEDENETITPFDKWLYTTYTQPYNISFKYKLKDIESDHKYNLVPAELRKSEVLAQIVKEVWFDAYDELVDTTFLKTYAPRLIHLVGSPAYNEDGSMTVGTAEGGLKVTLYLVNWINIESIDMQMLNKYYFHTMHHEFAHILHQTKTFDEDFQKISESNYIGNDWTYHNSDTVGVRSKGFISAYSMMNYKEDFVELYAYYVTNTEEWWNNQLSKGSEEGKAIINQKLDIVKDYFKTRWNIDMDDMRSVVLRRSDEVLTMDFLTLKRNENE